MTPFLRFLIVLVLLCKISTAQNVVPLSCGTTSLSEEQTVLLETPMRKALENRFRTTNAGTTCVPIKIHDVRDDTGNGAVNMTALNRGIANLNHHFAAANIEFFYLWCHQRCK